MSNSRYNSKKLQPFLKQQEQLTTEFSKLQQEYGEEEKLNDKYFDTLGQVEREYDTLIRLLQEYSKRTAEKSTTGNTDTKDMDGLIEINVIETLSTYLLTKSKKEQLQSLQEREIEKRDAQQQFLSLAHQMQNQLPDDDGGIDKDEYGYYITIISEEKQIEVKIPATVRTFKELKQIVKSCFMQEENEIFYTDQMGNLLQDEMNILDELYPPLYDLMKNYQPMVGIQIVKKLKQQQKEQIGSENESLIGEEVNSNLNRKLRPVRKTEKKIDWPKYLNYLNNLKYFFETILFLMVIGLLIVVEINEEKFVTNTQLLQAFQKDLSISKAYPYPIESIAQIINSTLISNSDKHIYPMFPLKSGLLVQTLVKQEDFASCSILNENQKQMYIDKNESCLDFDIILTDNISGDFTSTTINPSIYDPYYNGYVWELNLTSKEDFSSNYNTLISEKWIQYNIKQSQVIVNYYNSPSQRVIQAVFTTIYLFNDVISFVIIKMMLNYNSVKIEAFDLTPSTDQNIFFDEIIFYLSVILLSSSLFDFFGLYFKGTKNNLIVIYLQCLELQARQKKFKARKRELSHSEQQELQQKELIIGEFIIINLFKIVYLTIKIPLIFDIIYIICNIAILVRDTIKLQYTSVLEQIDIHSDSYQDVSKLITPLLVVRIYTGVLVLFSMASLIRFLGNWSPYLKCYGLVMIRFNRESSFLLLVLVYIIGFSALSWSITIQGKLIGQDNFFYDFIGLLRCTLKYGMHNDLSDLGLENNYQKDISYAFETRYIQYMITLVISFIMVPIFISLMTEQVHNTKIEAKQKMLEIKKEMENDHNEKDDKSERFK